MRRKMKNQTNKQCLEEEVKEEYYEIEDADMLKGVKIILAHYVAKSIQKKL